MVDDMACWYLGVLLGNKYSKHELEMVCGILFRGYGAKREVGVSLATAFSEESLQKLIGVLNNQKKKVIKLDVPVAATAFTGEDHLVNSTTTDTFR